MSEYTRPDPFAPEEIEEQIARRLADGVPEDAETRLVRGLAALYTVPAGTSEPVLARARERVRAAPIPPAAERTQPGRATTLAALPGTRARRPRALSTRERRNAWPALVAAVVVVALLAGLFHTLTAGRASQPPQPGQPTPTSAPTPIGTPTARGGWRTYPGLTAHRAITSIAPTDSRVAYVAGLQPDGVNDCTTCAPILRRTDDDGAHWRDLPLPEPLQQAKGIGVLLTTVSPLDAQTVLLTTLAITPGACPTGVAKMQQNGEVACTQQFLSSDGGQHWRDLALPAPGILALPTVEGWFFAGTHLAAQGDTLYMTLTRHLLSAPDVPLDTRLVVSRDGGASWQFADADLYRQGQAIYNFATPAHGTTVFALTDTAGAALNSGPFLSDPTPHFQLWRSDDQGAHWTRTGPLPSATVAGMAAANGSGGQSVLYMQVDIIGATGNTGAGAGAAAWKQTGGSVVGHPLSMPLAGPGMTTHLYASTDGGQHWTVAPEPGAPLSRDALLGLSTVLPSGEAVAMFTTGGAGPSVAFFRWKPGERQWRQLTPVLAEALGIDGVRFIPAGPGGPAALWVVYEAGTQDFTEAVASITLTGV